MEEKEIEELLLELKENDKELKQKLKELAELLRKNKTSYIV